LFFLLPGSSVELVSNVVFDLTRGIGDSAGFRYQEEQRVMTSLLTPATAAVVCSLAISGFALAQDKKTNTRPQDPAAIVVEHFCCDADGNCLPANANSVCPGGYTKVVNKTCEKGERGCNL
jgi:hypothetical protein